MLLLFPNAVLRTDAGTPNAPGLRRPGQENLIHFYFFTKAEKLLSSKGTP